MPRIEEVSATHVQIVQANVLVDTLNDDLNSGHDDQLREARFAEHSAERNEHSSWAKVGNQEASRN